MSEAGVSQDDQRNRVEVALGVRVPDRLWALYTVGDGRFRSDGQWWVVWPLERLLDENLRARGGRSATLPTDLIAFGDDGTGSPFCIPLDGADRVFRWSWIAGEVDGDFGTLDDFVAEWATDDR